MSKELLSMIVLKSEVHQMTMNDHDHSNSALFKRAPTGKNVSFAFASDQKKIA